MIISASRRTDIPAFYGEWFANRLSEGCCEVPNPFNSKQVSKISLRREDVDLFIFWTKNAAPFLRRLDELDRGGYPYCFLYTLNSYDNSLESGLPPLEARLETFLELSQRIGGGRVVWRYDPIVISERYDFDYHLSVFRGIAGRLQSACERVIISFVDYYGKTERRIRPLEESGEDRFVRDVFSMEGIDGFVASLADIATENGMTIQSCAEEEALTEMGIAPGKCIDDELIKQLFDIDVSARKDKGQRDACCCVESRDIGMSDSCLYDCKYCYATRSNYIARERHKKHNPESKRLIG